MKLLQESTDVWAPDNFCYVEVVLILLLQAYFLRLSYFKLQFSGWNKQ